MIIRQVKPADERYAGMLHRFPGTARYIADPADSGDYRFFAVLEDGQGIIGGAVIDIGELGFGPLKRMVVGFLEHIEVDEPFRRRGIGTALLRAALDHAWGCGAQNVRWTVDWSNDGGVAFYARCGVGVVPEGDSPQNAQTYYTLMAVNPQHVVNGYGSGVLRDAGP
jgi:GNAT superfamily N-acetyltransferase